jgi:hypothetical protein
MKDLFGFELRHQRTNTQLRIWALTTSVRTPVIFNVVPPSRYSSTDNAEQPYSGLSHRCQFCATLFNPRPACAGGGPEPLVTDGQQD